MSTDETRDLLARAQGGDQEAFAQLFEPCRARVHAVACRMVGPDDADDVTMDTYLKAWKSVASFRASSQLSTWLYRIAQNCARDRLRARKRRPEDTLPEDDRDGRGISDLLDPTATPPDQEIQREETRHAVRAALARLDDAHRQPLLLYYVDNLSYKEIAASLDLAIGTVMSRLFNAKRKMQRLLAEADADGSLTVPDKDGPRR